MRNRMVRDALCAALSLGAAAIGTARVHAQEEAPVDLGRMVTTGSRLSQIDLEGAKPIAVITREAIELSGQPTVADVLRSSTLNTFGSYREVSGNDWPGQAEIDLRGLGSGRTLVLLDGRRLPRSPVTGDQFIDLNVIPLEAIERIEILQDSASAIYGSDAIGGVVNIILRKGYEGVQFRAGGSSPTQAGGDESNGSVVFGSTSNRGSFLVSAERYEKDIVFDRDRPYAASNFGDGSLFGTTSGLSLAGNTAIDANTFDLIGLNSTDCESLADSSGSQLFSYYNYPSWGPGSTACAYPYADVEALSQQLKRQSAFVNASYEVSPELTVEYAGSYSRVEAFGRYAPAVALFEFALNGADLPASAPAEWQALGDFYLAHRFAAFGPRDNTTIDTQWHHAISFDGTKGAVDYKLDLYTTRYDAGDTGINYINRQAAIDLTNQGIYQPWDPLGASSQTAIPLMRYTVRRDISMDMFGATGTVNFEALELPQGPVEWVAGFDYGKESMFDRYDPASENGNVIGSAGNSRAGDRSYSAFFFEAGLPLTPNLDLSLAGREDRYSDVGSEFSPYLTVRWRANSNILVRGSAGQGFRAPNMTNLYQLRARGADPIVDYVQCRALGIADENCPDTQVNTYSGGNPGLVPEHSDSISVGAVFDYGRLYASVDRWNVHIKDGISIFSAQGLVDLQSEGQSLPPGTSIQRANGTTGPLIQIDTGWANVSKYDVTGTDLSLRYDLDTGRAGDFQFGLATTYINEYKQQTDPLSPITEEIGTDGQPQFRTNVSMLWNHGSHTVYWIARYIDSYVNSLDTTIPSWTTNDIQYDYDFSQWEGRLSVGVRNIADKDPPLDPANVTDQPFDSQLYSMDGRVPYVFYRHRF